MRHSYDSLVHVCVAKITFLYLLVALFVCCLFVVNPVYLVQCVYIYIFSHFRKSYNVSFWLYGFVFVFVIFDKELMT